MAQSGESCKFSCYVNPVSVYIKLVSILKMKYYFHFYIKTISTTGTFVSGEMHVSGFLTQQEMNDFSKGSRQRDRTLLYCSWSQKLKTAGS